MQDRLSEIELLKNYIDSLINDYENQKQYTTKVTDKKLLEAKIDTYHSVLNYLSDRKNMLTKLNEMNQVHQQ